MRKSDQFRVAGAQAAAVCFLINAGMSRSNQQACREQSEQACVCLGGLPGHIKRVGKHLFFVNLLDRIGGL